MVFWSYLATIFTEPGSVPPGWHPFILGDLETGSACPSVLDPSFAPRLAQLFDFPETLTATAAGRDPEEHARAKMERPRWCKKCQGWKPPRSHHCSVTRQCVLKMDHYCVWVGNTVGLLNYKAFVLFLFWAFLGCVIRCVVMTNHRAGKLVIITCHYLLFKGREGERIISCWRLL